MIDWNDLNSQVMSNDPAAMRWFGALLEGSTYLPARRSLEQNEADAAIKASMPKFSLIGTERGDVKKACLWDCVKQRNNGQHWTPFFQTTGSCVGNGGGMATNYVMAVEAWEKNEPEEVRYPLFYLYPYGRSRVYANLRGPGEGSFGSAFARAIKDDGIFDSKQPELPQSSILNGGITWGEQQERLWSWSPDSSELKRKWGPVAIKQPIRTVAQARSADDVSAGLRNGYASSCASMWGGKMKCDVVEGVLLNTKVTQWAHQMCLAPETKISLMNGLEVPIEDLAKDDEPFWVYSYEEETGRVIPKKATARMTRSSVPEGLVKITLDNGESISTTLDHKFLMRDGTWKEAKDLKTQDSLMPLYRRDGTVKDGKWRVGYEMLMDPGTQEWIPTHRRVKDSVHLYGYRFQNGKLVKIRKPGPAMAVVHHLDHDKRNNDPDNLGMMLKTEHWNYHAAFNDPSHMWKARKNPEYNKRQAEAARKAMLKLRQDPEFIRALSRGASENMKRQNSNPEFRKKKIEGTRKHTAEFWKDPENRRAAGVRFKATIARPDVQEKIAAANRKKALDPEFRKKLRAAARKRAADPAYRRKLSEGVRRARQKKLINHKVISVELLPQRTGPVYCLNVPGTENFAVSAGVFVHNCILGWWEHPKLGEIFWIQNSWGNPHGDDPAGGPPGGFWVKKADVEFMCKDEVFIFSNFQGFPVRQIDWTSIFS